eukprot:scaffold293438_cov37-Tisochrysis_lutea.AAC.2
MPPPCTGGLTGVAKSSRRSGKARLTAPRKAAIMKHRRSAGGSLRRLPSISTWRHATHTQERSMHDQTQPAGSSQTSL